MGLPLGDNTVISFFENNTVQFASQMGLPPISVLVKDGMMYPVFGKSAANCRIGSEAVADNLSTCPVAVPTQFFGYLCLEGHVELLRQCRGGLCQSLLLQCHSAGDSIKLPSSCWSGE